LANLLSEIDAAEAEALLRRALEGQEHTLGKEHPDTLTSVNNLAILLQRKGDYAGAEALQRRALEAQERTLGKEHPDTLRSMHNLAILLNSKGDPTAAESLFRRVLEGRDRKLGQEHPETLSTVHELAVLLQKKGDYAGAESLAREWLAIAEKKSPDDWQIFNTRSLLGACLLGLQKPAEAEPLLLSGYEGMKLREQSIPTSGRPLLKEAIQRLVQLYETTDRKDQATEWQRKLAEFEQAEAAKQPNPPPR
jgi:tetratricopeptide (TPR) repeat protein